MKESVTWVERWCRPLDWMRWRLLKGLGGWIRPFLVNRDLRVAVGGSLLLLFTLGMALSVPFWLLALGPILWGVPHVVSDIRYLVVRPGHHKKPVLWFAVGLPLLAVATGQAGVLGGLTAAAGVLIVMDGPALRKSSGLLTIGVLALGAWYLGNTANIVFAHLHNFIAVGLWWFWRKRWGLHFWPLGIFLLASTMILLGVFDPLYHATRAVQWSPQGLEPHYHLMVLAPGMAPASGLRWVLLFAFAQAVHYGMWLRLIPEDDRPRPTPRTYAASFRALRAELGLWVLALVAVTALVFAIWAVIDLAQARLNYLRMAIFHGHLELAAAALFWLKGRDGFWTPPKKDKDSLNTPRVNADA